MAKVNKTIAKLKNLYTTFGYEYTPYSAKEIKELQKTITLPKILEEYYKKIGSLEGESDFPIHIVSPSSLSFSKTHLVFAHEMQGVCSYALKKEDLTLDNPPVYINMEGEGWKIASSYNEEEINFENLLEFFYTIARMMGVDPEPRNTEKNIAIVQDVLVGKLPDDAISNEVIENITSLKFEHVEITNLQAIAKLKNLSYLVLKHCNITTIEPFLGLTKLQFLECNDNAISSIEGVDRLTKLKRLYLPKNKITDISPIAKMKSLTYLFLNVNNIEDISPIKEVKGLEGASFECNNIKDISIIEQMPTLRSFNAGSNQISVLPAFTADFQLYELRLHNNQIANIDAVLVLKELGILWIFNNPIKDTSVFKKLKHVQYLVIEG